MVKVASQIQHEEHRMKYLRISKYNSKDGKIIDQFKIHVGEVYDGEGFDASPNIANNRWLKEPQFYHDDGITVWISEPFTERDLEFVAWGYW